MMPRPPFNYTRSLKHLLHSAWPRKTWPHIIFFRPANYMDEGLLSKGLLPHHPTWLHMQSDALLVQIVAAGMKATVNPCWSTHSWMWQGRHQPPGLVLESCFSSCFLRIAWHWVFNTKQSSQQLFQIQSIIYANCTVVNGWIRLASGISLIPSYSSLLICRLALRSRLFRLLCPSWQLSTINCYSRNSLQVGRAQEMTYGFNQRQVK